MSQRRLLANQRRELILGPNVHTTSSKLKSTGSTSKEGIVTTSNSYAALVNDDEEDGEQVTHVNEDLANPNPCGSSSFTLAAG